jgi:signal peptidase I
MKEPQKKHYFETTGFSMWPFIKQEDRIVVEEVGAGELNSGDIVLYKVDNQLVCHRLVNRKKSDGKYLLFTRGDNVPSWKAEAVNEAQLVGRACGIVRRGRLIALKGVWQAICARFIIAVFPLAVMALVSISNIVKKR